MRKKRKKHNIRLWAAALAAALCFCMAGAIRPAAEAAAVYQAKAAAGRILNMAVLAEYESFREDFPELVRVEYGSDGQITSIRMDALAAGIFKELVQRRILSELDGVVESPAAIPLGTLTGSVLLSGYGPRLPLRFVLSGAPAARLESRFASAGLNQSVHRVLISFSVEIRPISPLSAKAALVTGEVLLSETVIVGAVPEYYFGR